MIKSIKQTGCINLILSGLFLLAGCYHVSDTPEIDNNSVPVKIKRFEHDLFSIPLDSVINYIPGIKTKYPSFFELFNNYIISIGGSGTPGYSDRLTEFLTNYDVNLGYNLVNEKFPDIAEIEKGLSEAFSYYHHYFPDKQIPEVLTFISGFNESIVIDDSLIAVSLDKYLGADCGLYSKIGFQSYVKKNMHKEKIVSDCIDSWMKTEFIYNDSIDNLLSQMIYNGKIFYLVKTLLPTTPDSLIMGFTKEQLEFCTMNEKKMWKFLVENKMLFSSDRLVISKFINDGPFTNDFTRNSPARAATWIGWQIINKYMKKNKVTVRGLMHNNNYMDIYNNARYIP